MAPGRNITEDNLVLMRDISVSFGKVKALDGVNFSVGHDEIVGLLGDNGAGKTTLIKTLLGLIRRDSGEIFYDGKRVDFRSPAEARVAGIETVYQDLALVNLMDIERNFFLGREIVKKVGPFRFLDKKKMRNFTEAHLDTVGFRDHDTAAKLVNSLSGGERQKLAIARACNFSSKLLILDEPTASLSETETEEILDIVLEAKKKGISVIFVTHNAQEVFEVADRFVVIQNGRNLANISKKDTDLKEIEKLIISSRLSAIRQMAARVAHQIRNPLGIMKVTAEMLRDDFEVKKNKKDHDRLTTMLLNEIDTLNTTINNFLDFAKQLKIKRGPVRIEEIIEGAMLNVPINKFENVRLYMEIKNRGKIYNLDRRLIEQAIGNILNNAFEASKPGKSVTLKSFENEDKMVIEVKDQGEGFDMNNVKQLFSPFFSTKTNGTGLGLSIVKRIVEEHGGSVTAESQPGHGSLFRINLPKFEANP